MQKIISDPAISTKKRDESSTGLESFLLDFKNNIEKYIDVFNSDELTLLMIEEWLTGEDDDANKNIILARQQAARAYPALIYDMWNRGEIRKAIDNRKPLTPVLAKYYEVDKRFLKRIQGKTRIELGTTNNHVYLYNILHLKEKYFQQFKNNLSDLHIIYEYSEHIYRMSVHEFLDYLFSKGIHPLQHIERMKENSVYDVRDAFQFLCSKLFLPALLNRIKDHAEKNNLSWLNEGEKNWNKTIELLKKHTNIKSIFDFSERYHRNLFRWQDMFNFDSRIDFISWRPMFDRIDLGDGWVAREIHSVTSLKEQGRRENHCVGGYAKSILEREGKSARLIFSLEKDGEIKSTIDMLCSKNKEKNGFDVKIQQNRARSNKNPSLDVLKYSDIFVEKIKHESDNRLDIYLENLIDVRKEYYKIQSYDEFLSKCEYNPWDRDILENVWDEFKPALRRKLRRLGLDAFIDMIPLDGIIFQPRKKNDPLYPWDDIKNEQLNQANYNDANLEMFV